MIQNVLSICSVFTIAHIVHIRNVISIYQIDGTHNKMVNIPATLCLYKKEL